MNDGQEMVDVSGHLNLPAGKIWYRMHGKSGLAPLLVLHGGPGGPSDYLWNLDKLATDRPVIFYDQLGCGRSDRRADPKFWTVEYFVEELKLVRELLQLDSMHLFGHSWGTMLALDYLTDQPTGIKSVTFASPCISIPRWVKVCNRHLDELPNHQGDLIRRCEREGNTAVPEYKAALRLYSSTHENRVGSEHPLIKACNNGSFGSEVYNYMWGPNEYTLTGTLKDYDHSELLSDINLPTLFTCGRLDSASPEDVAFYQSHIPDAELNVFENCAHLAHLEDEEHYLDVVREFLQRHD